MNKFLKYLLLISVFIAFISTVSYCSAPFDTETAQTVSIRKTVSGEGYILRNETPVTLNSKGAFEPGVQNGVRVAKGSTLGVIISGNYSEDLVKKLKDVTERIDEIEKSSNFADIYASDEARIFSALKDISRTIRENVRNENYLAASENALQLNTLLEKKYSAENQGAGKELLVKLQQEKYELEKQLGGIREDIKAPASGYFYPTLDGLEQAIKEADLFSISPGSVKRMSDTLKNYNQSPSDVGKITDTYGWYLVTILPLEEANLLTEGSSVTISIDEAAEVKATISAINPDEAGRCAVVVKCTHDVKDIFEKRTVEFEICYEEHEGIYVPSAAIRVIDEITGVYILNQNESVSFRCVDILLQEDDYYVVRKNYTPPEDIKYSALKLYDDILVNPEVVRPNELKK